MIHLEKVNARNVWKLLQLQVKEEQKEFVATNTESIVEVYTTISAGGTALPFGIFDDDTPVGFLMIGFGTDEEWENPPVYARNGYSIWRLMIDKHHQHKGYGQQAMQLALDYIQTWPCGKSDVCYLSYEPENLRAKALYSSFGFAETGDYDGDEIIAVKKLD